MKRRSLPCAVPERPRYPEGNQNPSQPTDRGRNQSMTPTSTEALRDLVAANLVTARERTELLTGSVGDGDLVR